MDDAESPSLCFPGLNSSCRRLLRTQSETCLLYVLLASVSLLAVMLNLLVIISISHFRQLHTATNALLLSLAVSDFTVGLLVMPIEGLRYVETCWLLGKLMCAVTPLISYCLVTVSVGNMVLMSMDRYLAICDPLLYSTRVTLTKVKICLFLVWVFSILYNGLLLMDHIGWPDRFNSCYGECVVVINYSSGTVDLFITFIGPCTVMVVLYMRVFLTAVAQMRAIRSQMVDRAAPRAKRAETKAARTLGIVIVVFLLCFCPYYYPALSGQDTSTSLSSFAILSWIMLTNSCMNPLIYALFYPWFRRAIGLVLTLRILKKHSRDIKIL